MSHNSFGHLFRVTTWGESHGPAIGCVVDGCPPRLALTEADIQPWLDRRRPGQSRFTTQRQEPDQVRILSGVFEGADHRHADRAADREHRPALARTMARSRDRFRPGHADLTYELKYGIRDYRGGGRSSARGDRDAGRRRRRRPQGAGPRRHASAAPWCRSARTASTAPAGTGRRSTENPFFCPDRAAAAPLGDHCSTEVRKSGSSLGAVIEVVAEGVPPGLGAPIYGKLDADIAAALMGINAVKGVEIGDGFAAAALTGEANADEMRMGPDGRGGLRRQPCRRHPRRHLHRPADRRPLRGEADQLHPDAAPAGGPLRARTSRCCTKGRHDPCVGIRAVPVGEAMLALVLADHLLRHRAQNPDAPGEARLPRN